MLRDRYFGSHEFQPREEVSRRLHLTSRAQRRRELKPGLEATAGGERGAREPLGQLRVKSRQRTPSGRQKQVPVASAAAITA